jgi:nitroreductase/NAD-dependent dihydropyrimidine dehydrogenase PreA subunit
MNMITVDAEACERDGLCSEVCPTGCIEAGPDGLPQEAPENPCIACGHCVAVCPKGAIANAKLEAAEFGPVPKNLPDSLAVRGLMLARRSVREFKDKPVARETLTGLLDTARFAPTAVNSQLVSFAACVDPAKVRNAAEMCIEWLRGSGMYQNMVKAWDQGREVALRGAPAIVVAHSPADYPWGETDCVIALSYLELAAASEGLGVCWAGLLTMAAQAVPALARLLGVAEGQVVRGGLMLGYAKYRYQLVPPRQAAKVSWV